MGGAVSGFFSRLTPGNSDDEAEAEGGKSTEEQAEEQPGATKEEEAADKGRGDAGFGLQSLKFW